MELFLLDDLSLTSFLEGPEINYKEIIEERYKLKAENFEYIGITTSFLARKLLDVNTLEEVSQPTILLFKDDE